MAEYIMALDAGTTSNRCILFDRYASVCAVAQKEFTQIYPKSGYVEHNANEIWATQLSVAVEAMQKLGIGAEDIAAIGITNQRETTIVWDRQTGEPVYNAIVWQCRRTSKFCDELKARGLADGYWITYPVRGRRRSAGSFASARWTHGSCGSFPAAEYLQRIIPTHPARCFLT